jgi:hypothetical protein
VLRGGSAGCADPRFYLPQDLGQIRSAGPMPPADFRNSDAVYNSYVRTLAAWVTSSGGWPATNSIRFSVENSTHQATILTGMRVNLISRAPLASRTVLSLSECGGAVSPRPFSVDFGAAPPRLRPLPGETTGPTGNAVATRPVDFPFTVSDTDPEIFDLDVADGPVCDCLWTVTLSYIQVGRSYLVQIDDHGMPFHAVPTDEVPAYTLINGILEPES